MEIELMKNKYSGILDSIYQMMKPVSKSRPSCQELLDKKNSWALNSAEFKSIVDQKRMNDMLISSKTIEESFHEYFIRKKLG